MDLEGNLGVAHDRLGDATSVSLLDAAKPVGGRELSGLVLRMSLELPTLDLELALQELRLRGHRDVLPRRHGKRARDEARQPGEQDDRRDRVRTRNPEDQRDVGEQAVADAEDRRACGPTLKITVVGPFVRLSELARLTGRSNRLCHMEKYAEVSRCGTFSAPDGSSGSRRKRGVARSSGWRGSR